MYFRTNYLSEQDIEDPYRAHLATAVDTQMDDTRTIGRHLYLHRNTLERFDTYDQLITEPITDGYLSYEGESIDSTVVAKPGKRIYC